MCTYVYVSNACVCACIYTYTHICFFAREVQEEVSYNHIQIWMRANEMLLMVMARSIGMMFFQPCLQLWHFYPGKSGKWFGMPILHGRKLRSALSHKLEDRRQNWDSRLCDLSLCLQFYFPVTLNILYWEIKRHLCDLSRKDPNQYKLIKFTICCKAGNRQEKSPSQALLQPRRGAPESLQCSHHAWLHSETGTMVTAGPLWSELTSSPFPTMGDISFPVAYSTLSSW